MKQQSSSAGWRFALALAACLFASLGAEAFNKSMYPYELPAGKQGAALGCIKATPGMKLELGKWYTNWKVCKDYCDKNGIPLVMIWSNETCIHCWYCDVCFIQDRFKEWAATHNAGKVIYCFMSGEKGGTLDQVGSEAYNWMWYGGGKKLNAYPFTVLWWKKMGVNVRQTGDQLCDSTSFMDSSIPKRTENLIAALEAAFKGWAPVEYAGGKIALDETEGNRLEAEPGMTELAFELTRAEDVAQIATNNLVALIGPDGVTKETITVDWKAGETVQTVKIDVSKAGFSENGQRAKLVVRDSSGVDQGTNHVTYVEGNSVGNPLWIGERSASGGAGLAGAGLANVSTKPELAFGEWTMDLNVATQKVAAAEGDAYTLVAIEGSLWCHDCANAERNFMNAKDDAGRNRFAEWAKAKNVALVAVDVPNFNTNSVNASSPTLLSRKAYETVLAYEMPEMNIYEVSKGGAPEALTQPMKRSGLGYLTRKGASDEEAAAVLERNWRLVTKNTGAGGFHRPEDTNRFRTGVPIYVLLRKDSTVAARFTRFASASPMADVSWNDVIRRFDEMLAIAKAVPGDARHEDIENNDASTTVVSFKANGGGSVGEISHADFQDVFKLEGVGGNALQKVIVAGESSATVQVQFQRLSADGKSVNVGAAATGRLSDGIALEQTFTEAGNFFVKVSGGDIAAGDFKADDARQDNFAAFSISGTVVFVPQEERAVGYAAEDASTLTMRLEKGCDYRLQGVDTTKIAGVLAPYAPENTFCQFFTALNSGDFDIPCAYGPGGSIMYQKWIPCTIGFTSESKAVQENVGEVRVAVARKDGKSGKVKAKVSIDAERTTLYDSEGHARFEFEPVALVWNEGENHETNVVVKVFDDMRYDGDGDIALKLELVSGEGFNENGDTRLATTNFVVSVAENDKASPGQAAFTRVEPFFSKKQTVYAKESDGATIYVSRVGASDGLVTAQLKSSLNGVSFKVGEDVTNVVAWANHKYEDLKISVAGIPAGKSATLTLEKPTGGLKIVAASNNVTVVSVADDAPEFGKVADKLTLYRYVAVSNVYPVVLASGSETAKLTFTKLDGALPAGLSVKYDAAAQALALVGAVTAKPGLYRVVYQVTQQLNGRRTLGLTTELVMTVVDPTAMTADAPYNEAIAGAGGKARTFSNIPVIDMEARRMTGVLTVTIPVKGRVSAKYMCADGTVSFSSKNWSGFDPETGTLSAEMATRTNDYALALEAESDGSLDIVVVGPEGRTLVAPSNGNVWSKENPANNPEKGDWSGYYTVTLPAADVSEAEGMEGVAPRGAGYLTLKMNTAGDWNKGQMKWAGKLSNGTAVSGTAVLVNGDECQAYLPIFKRSSTDVISALARVNANAQKNKQNGEGCQAVFEADDVQACWIHTEKLAEASYEVELDMFGSLYDANENLASSCLYYYETTTPDLTFDISALKGWVKDGIPGEVAAVGTVVTNLTGGKAIQLAPKQANPQKITLSLNRSTGIVTGSFNLPYTDAAGVARTIKANYAGVVLIGWGAGCGCGPSEGPDTILPFVNGAFCFSGDSVKVDRTTVRIKRGGAMKIDVKALE